MISLILIEYDERQGKFADIKALAKSFGGRYLSRSSGFTGHPATPNGFVWVAKERELADKFLEQLVIQQGMKQTP